MQIESIIHLLAFLPILALVVFLFRWLSAYGRELRLVNKLCGVEIDVVDQKQLDSGGLQYEFTICIFRNQMLHLYWDEKLTLTLKTGEALLSQGHQRVLTQLCHKVESAYRLKQIQIQLGQIVREPSCWICMEMYWDGRTVFGNSPETRRHLEVGEGIVSFRFDPEMHGYFKNSWGDGSRVAVTATEEEFPQLARLAHLAAESVLLYHEEKGILLPQLRSKGWALEGTRQQNMAFERSRGGRTRWG